MIKSILFAGTLWACLASAVCATDYYISPSGNDSNSGTQTQPWASIAKVNGKSFAAGDRILFQGGQTFAGNLSFGSDDTGTSTSPITVSTYGLGKATINAGSGSGISVTDTAGIRISNLILTGAWNATSQSGNGGTGISYYSDLNGGVKLNYIRVDQVEVKGFKSGGVIIGAYPADGSKSGFNDVQVTNSLVHDNGDVGISSYGYFNASSTQYAHSNFYVGACQVYNNRGIQNKGSNSGNGIVLSDVNVAKIEHCVAHDNGDLNNNVSGGPCGIWCWESNAVTIQYNEAYSNKTAAGAADGDGFDFDGGVSNSIMQYNYAHENYAAGILVWEFNGARPLHDNIIRYNICQHNGLAANYYGEISTGGGGASNIHIYNNTLYATSGSVAAIRVESLSNSFVRNNLLVTTGGIPLVIGTSATFQGNDYWASGGAVNIAGYSSLAAFRSGTGQETLNGQPVGLSVDPVLTNPGGGGILGDAGKLNTLSAYRLQLFSPMIDAGLNLVSLFGYSVGATDFYGNTLPQGSGYDIGAHERTAYSQLFYDNFEADTVGSPALGWTASASTWTVIQPSSNSKEYTNTGTGDSTSFAGSSSWTDYFLQGYINMSNASGGACLLGRVQDASHYYQFELRQDLNGTGTNMWYIWKNSGGAWTQIASGPFNWAINTYYLVRFDLTGSDLTTYYSSNFGSTFNKLGHGTDTQYANGQIGLRSWNSGGRFDEIKVVKN